MQFGSHHFNNSKILQEALALFSFSSKLFSGPKKKKKKKKRTCEIFENSRISSKQKIWGLFGKLLKKCFRFSNAAQISVIQMDFQMWSPPLTHFLKPGSKRRTKTAVRDKPQNTFHKKKKFSKNKTQNNAKKIITMNFQRSWGSTHERLVATVPAALQWPP
jgi:hypothetical protein